MKTTTASAIKSIKNNRKIKVFLFFLVLSSIIWVLIELSKSFITPVVFNVEYTDLPKDKMVQKKPVSELELQIKAPGFMLLKYKLKKRKIILSLKNISRSKNAYYLLPNKQISSLNSQFSNEIEIMGVLRDTIFIEIGNSISKKVPIIPKLGIQYKAGYNLVEKLKITPDSVIISGPKKLVDSITAITTSPLKLNEVYKDIELELSLNSPYKSGQIKMSAIKIKVKGKVEKFTEGTFKIPVTIINVPFGVKVTTFPKEIEVIYQAGLSNFNKITRNDVSVVFDYKQYENDTLISYLTPIIEKQSDLIYALKINPPQLEFLIEK
ncbi:MAG: YbbR-like domain-containing protein [Lutibacter sp.]|nr:YbbR-like domain-containing protein [Lutibacter sp.]MDT8418417.1 YbbR-like domain-containing protein [Lutibacter sp.]